MNEQNLQNTQLNTPEILFRGHPINNKAVWMPAKVLIHGANGTKKTRFGCIGTPYPALVDLEGNAGNIQAPTLHKERLLTYDATIAFLKEILETDVPFKTVVLDSLTFLIDLYIDKIRSNCKDEKELKALMAYGTEYKLCMGEMVKVRKLLDDIHTKKKMHIIILAQTSLKMVKDPLVEVYERWEPKAHDGCAAIFMDWVSCVFFARNPKDDPSYKSDEQGEKGATTKFPVKGRKMPYNKSDDTLPWYLYTNGGAGYSAKNTFNLPDKILNDWKSVTDLMRENFNKGF